MPKEPTAPADVLAEDDDSAPQTDDQGQGGENPPPAPDGSAEVVLNDAPVATAENVDQEEENELYDEAVEAAEYDPSEVPSSSLREEVEKELSQTGESPTLNAIREGRSK